ncbi:hypothetical protein ACFVH9_08540 [Streptomyces hirsutus]|uniref:hypothetical protein n=1 Tax=Streptomyces hirsutus TaxID=35620 RepID=UPI0036371305
MSTTDAVSYLDCHEPAATDDGGMLPPYSAEDAICPKCLYGEAFTWYRAAITQAHLQDWNDTQVRRGPLPQRLERECSRCTYRWDESLAVEHAGMTVSALAYALDNATPYPVELHRQVLEHMAQQLLAMLRITARPDHSLWQHSDGATPPATPPDTDTAAEETDR